MVTKKINSIHFYAISFKRILIWVVLPVFGVLSACSTPGEFQRERPTNLPAWEKSQVLLAPVSFLYQANGYRNDKIRFEKNSYIGRLHFSGGYVSVQARRGILIQSKKTEFALFQDYKKKITQDLQTELMKIMQARNIKVNIPDSSKPLILEKFSDSVVYTKSPDEGRDNVNLPRYEYKAPLKLGRNIQQSLIKQSANSKYVLIPVVQQYYTHNAGWFLDQEIGCLAGSRISISFVLYDLETGVRQMDMRVENKKIYPLKSSLNINESYRDLKDILQGLLANFGETIISQN